MLKYAFTFAALLTGLGWWFTPAKEPYWHEPVVPCHEVTQKHFLGLRSVQMARLEADIAREVATDATDAYRLDRLRDEWRLWDELEPGRVSCKMHRFEVAGS